MVTPINAQEANAICKAYLSLKTIQERKTNNPFARCDTFSMEISKLGRSVIKMISQIAGKVNIGTGRKRFALVE